MQDNNNVKGKMEVIKMTSSRLTFFLFRRNTKLIFSANINQFSIKNRNY
jgi:hypothetical protein